MAEDEKKAGIRPTKAMKEAQKSDEEAAQSAREADEFLEVVPLPMSRVLEMVRSGEIGDAKTIAAVLYVAGYGGVLER